MRKLKNWPKSWGQVYALSLKVLRLTLIWGASPGLSYKLWDKNIIGWWRWNASSTTHERKIGDLEIEIISFVVYGSVKLTIPLDRQ